MPVRARPWQHKSREGFKPLRWDSIGAYKDHVTNEEVRNRIQNAVEVHDHGKVTETQMVWPHLKILGHGDDNSAGEVRGCE